MVAKKFPAHLWIRVHIYNGIQRNSPKWCKEVEHRKLFMIYSWVKNTGSSIRLQCDSRPVHFYCTFTGKKKKIKEDALMVALFEWRDFEEGLWTAPFSSPLLPSSLLPLLLSPASSFLPFLLLSPLFSFSSSFSFLFAFFFSLPPRPFFLYFLHGHSHSFSATKLNYFSTLKKAQKELNNIFFKPNKHFNNPPFMVFTYQEKPISLKGKVSLL